MEKKIYNGWAFTDNESEKGNMNREIHKELIESHRIYRDDLRLSPEVNEDDYDVIIGRKAGYNHAVYSIIKNEPNLTTDELLLLCDGGNLCFGGSKVSGNQMRVSED